MPLSSHTPPHRCDPSASRGLDCPESGCAAPDAGLTPAPRPPEETRELARLVPLWPAELADTTLSGRKRLLAKLERALRAERRRGLAGHWTYDLARHAQLLSAFRRERAAVQSLCSPGASREWPEGPANKKGPADAGPSQ